MLTQLIPFETKEYQVRYLKLRNLMSNKGINALLLLGGNNIFYFCGYPAPVISTPRPFFLLLPLIGEPIFLVHTGRLKEAKAYNWISDIRTYETLTHLPPQISSIIKEAGLSKATIGCEMGIEMSMNLPLDQFEDLKKQMSDAHFIDASGILWELRMIKSPAELDCHRKACRITGDVYSTIFRQVRKGMTQAEIYRRFMQYTLELGGENQFVFINSGEGTYDFVSGLPSEKKLQKGDMLWLDSGCSVNRYWSDFSRAAVIGNASKKQKAMHRRIVDITQRCVSMIRPGISCAELAFYCDKGIAKLQESLTSSISGLAGRSGHGLGLEITEPPHISVNETRLLEPGMVITIEPGVATEYGTFHFEQNIIVTHQGYEILSQFPQDFIEVSI